MVRLTVTVPDAVYRGIHDLSQREKIPLDQLVALVLSEKLSAMMTEDYLQKRAARGRREKFLAVLAKARNEEPEEHDRPPSGVSYDFIELTRADAPPSVAQMPKYDGEPYRGLQAFEEDNAVIFFGREREIQSLLKTLAQRRFVAVLGASGSGKSSLVKAGVLPKLRGGHELGNAWQIASMTPRKNPLKRLEHAISGDFKLTVDDDLRTAADVRRVLYPDNGAEAAHGLQFLLFIDQFEELFTECKDETWRRAFIELILAADSGLRVLITLRADFLGQCAEYPDLAAALGGHVLLAVPDAAGLRAAITQPLAFWWA
jgi:hypothetical protein